MKSRYRYTGYLFLLFSVISILSCGGRSRIGKEKTYKESEYIYPFPPPNCIQIDDNFYVDETEVSNLVWKEYSYDIVRQAQSDKKWKEVIADTSVWTKLDSSLTQFGGIYFRSPMFDPYPVIGITHQQAIDFCKWRSDVVNEMLLISKGLLDPSTDSNFTTEEFLKGAYKTKKPRNLMVAYVTFRLPTINEFREIAKLDIAQRDKCSQKEERQFNFDLLPIRTICDEHNEFQLFHIHDNVSEMVAEEGVFVGASWFQNKTSLAKYQGPEPWLGFRCVAEWQTINWKSRKIRK